MEIDKWGAAQWLQVFTAVTTAVFAASTLWLAVKQHLANKRGLLREEYKFAKEFFEDVLKSPPLCINSLELRGTKQLQEFTPYHQRSFNT